MTVYTWRVNRCQRCGDIITKSSDGSKECVGCGHIEPIRLSMGWIRESRSEDACFYCETKLPPLSDNCPRCKLKQPSRD